MATNHLLFAPQTAKVCGSSHIRACTVFIRKQWFRAQHLPRAFLLSPPCRSQTNYNLYLTVCLRLTAASLTAYSRCRLRHEVQWTSREYALLTPYGGNWVNPGCLRYFTHSFRSNSALLYYHTIPNAPPTPPYPLAVPRGGNRIGKVPKLKRFNIDMAVQFQKI